MRTRVLRGLVLALLVGSVAVIGPAGSAPAQVPELPPELSDLEPILGSVGQILASLSPLASFDLDEEGTLFSSGAGVEISGVYSCAKTVDVAVLLPHVTAQSITVDAEPVKPFETKSQGFFCALSVAPSRPGVTEGPPAVGTRWALQGHPVLE